MSAAAERDEAEALAGLVPEPRVGLRQGGELGPRRVGVDRRVREASEREPDDHSSGGAQGS